MRSRFAIVVFVLAAVRADAQFAAAVGADGVTVRGVTPKAEVILFARTHQYIGGTPHLGRHLLVERDEDGDGMVAVAIKDLPANSVWIAIDQVSGDHAVAAPEGFELRTLPMSEGASREGATTFEAESGFLDFVLVRPGQGAWQLDVLQGSKRDDDGKNDSTLRARLDAFTVVSGKEKAPAHVTGKDVLAVIDPRTLDVHVRAAR